ncbi:hypothetical protein C8Q80DRAFT_1198483 [Daedaleopsis nitida]|nr:hypothetical protein C8Q80DRAFT_1198483 [Daedaleopsis nitida]
MCKAPPVPQPLSLPRRQASLCRTPATGNRTRATSMLKDRAGHMRTAGSVLDAGGPSDVMEDRREKAPNTSPR